MSLTIELPKFNHPEVEAFYEHDLSIPKEKVAAILELPRATLIQDIETMLLDTIERKDFFKNYLDKDKWWEMPIHAVWMLVELKAVETLPSIFEVLKQDDDYINSFLGDYATEDFWEVLYHLGGNNLASWNTAVLSPGEWINRIVPSTAAEQIALYQPARRTEVIDWYRFIVDAFLAMEDGDAALDGAVISSLVGDLINIQAVELLPEIKALAARGLVYDSYVGNMKSIEEDIAKPSTFSGKRILRISIFDKYENAMQWHGYLMKYDEVYKEKNTYKPQEIDASSYSIPETVTSSNPTVYHEPVGTIKREGKKIGRNDPCPCGSEKKYKKCCLKK